MKSNNRTIEQSHNLRRGFTLIEMLVVIGIILTLMGAGFGGYSHMARKAQEARGRETVSNAATALNLLFQKFGYWPDALRNQAAGGAGRLLPQPAACLAVNKLMSLTYTQTGEDGNKVYTLSGNDRCGIITPWAMDAIKRAGVGGASDQLRVPTGGKVADHVLYYALDLTGEGFVNANVGGKQIKVRANAVVWCAGMDGRLDPYPHAGGGKKGPKSDDIYSWSPNQVENK